MNRFLALAALLFIAACAARSAGPIGWPKPDGGPGPVATTTESGSPGDYAGCLRRQARRADDSASKEAAAGQVASACKNEAIKTATAVTGLPPPIAQAVIERADNRLQGDAARAVGKERRADRRQANKAADDPPLPYGAP
jgi:hypothetical protein